MGQAAVDSTGRATSMQGRPSGCGQVGSGTRCQLTSGRSSSHVTRPPVARSIAGQRSGGIDRVAVTHWCTAGALTPIALASVDRPPASRQAERIADMRKL